MKNVESKLFIKETINAIAILVFRRNICLRKYPIINAPIMMIQLRILFFHINYLPM